MQNKAIIKITYKCNNNCTFCHSKLKKNNKDINFLLFKKKINLLNTSINTILLSGGEPTLHHNFIKFLDYASYKGLNTGLITNARIFSNIINIKKIQKYNLKYCYTTLLCHDQYINNKITKSNSYDEIIKGIINIKKRNIILLVNIVITKKNLHQINSTVSLLKKLKVEKIKISFAEPIDEKSLKEIPNIEKASEIVKEILNHHKKHVGWDGFPLCLMKGYETRIENLRTNNIKFISEIWDKKNFPVDEGNKIKLLVCNSCNKKDICEGIYKNYINYRSVNLKPY